LLIICNIHIYFVDAKDFLKKKDLMFTIFYKNVPFGKLGCIWGYIAIYWVDGVKGLRRKLLL
jgi:hypothetical protein